MVTKQNGREERYHMVLEALAAVVMAIGNEKLKSRRFMLLLSLLLLGITIERDGYAGDENLASSPPPIVYTENDFAFDSTLRIPILQTAVTFLEPPDTDNNVDTYESGVDGIPYYFKESSEYRFCWEGGIDGSQHHMYLQDETGNVVLKIVSGGDCVTATIGAGSYTMFFVHDGLTTDVQPILIVANSGETDQGIRQKGSHPVTLLVSNRLCGNPDLTGADLNNGNLSRAKLRSGELSTANLSGAYLTQTKLIDANLRDANLRNANLSKADLRVANLRGADLTQADLRRAYLSGAYLSEANLRNADLRGADLGGADLSGADLTQADLRGAYLKDAKLSFVNLSGADLTQANLGRTYLFEGNLKGANLRGANLRGAYLKGANLSGATWTNGKVCDEGSTGRCN